MAVQVIRKIQATNELFCKALGSIDTREKFEARRLQLASHVWEVMKKTDSRECRNCHDYDSMDFPSQGRRAMAQHSVGLEEGKTCTVWIPR
jgi:cytochrome c-type protein NapC